MNAEHGGREMAIALSLVPWGIQPEVVEGLLIKKDPAPYSFLRPYSLHKTQVSKPDPHIVMCDYKGRGSTSVLTCICTSWGFKQTK